MKIKNLIYIFNPFLLGIFFILFLFSSNLGEMIMPIEIFSLFLIVCLFEVSIFIILIIFFKDLPKSSFLLTIIMFLFLSYGYFYDLFNQINFLNFIFRHRFLLPAIALSLLFLLIYFKRKDIGLNNTNRIIFISLTFLIFINIFQIIIFNQKPVSPLVENINIENFDDENAPDVFHIVLDMYPTNKILESRFNFDNEEFSEELNLIGFINEDLKANYIRTMYSLPSTFNMNHFYNSNQDEIVFMKETLKKFHKSVEGNIANK